MRRRPKATPKPATLPAWLCEHFGYDGRLVAVGIEHATDWQQARRAFLGGYVTDPELIFGVNLRCTRVAP